MPSLRSAITLHAYKQFRAALAFVGGLLRRARAAFLNYLFRPGGAYTLAICRIALFGYLYIHVYAGALGHGLGRADYHAQVNLSGYHAKSLLYLLFPSTPPSIEVLHAVLLLAQISTICAMLGLATRIAMVTSVASMTFLGAVIYAWEPLWSHPYNGGLIAAIGFMFGRAGDVLSLDSALARHLLRRPLSIARQVYHWPLVLGLFGATIVYFGGFYAKWSTPEWTFTLSWALSDNLRNAASLPWLIFGQEPPPHVAILVSTPWLWRLAALAHLATQLLPVFALFCFDRPWLRLAEGVVFCAGVVLLKAVMGFWNPEWLLLSVFFVDWEHFLRKLGLLRAAPAPAPLPPRTVGPELYAAAFIGLNLFIVAIRYDDRGSSRLFPFTSMNFYSNVAALRPYGEHRYYPFNYAEVFLNFPGGETRKWNCYPGLTRNFAVAYGDLLPARQKLAVQLGEIGALQATLAGLKGAPAADCAAMLATEGYESVDFHASILDIPPFPEKVRFELGHRALIGRYELDRRRAIAAAGRTRFLTGRSRREIRTYAVEIASAGMDVARYEILLANDPWQNYRIGPLLPAPGRFEGDSFEIDEDFYRRLPLGDYPVVIRVVEKDGRHYDFFGGLVHRLRGRHER